MPLLATLLLNLVTFIAAQFARFFVLEKAFKISQIVVMIALITALFFSLSSATSGALASAIAGMSADHPNFSVGLGIVFNSVTLAGVAVYMTIWGACQLYVIKKKSMMMFG